MSADELKKVLSDTGTKIISAHIYPFDKEKYEKILEYNAQVGTEHLIYPMDRFRDLDDVMQRCELLNEYGEMTDKYGIRFSYHNHANEFMTIGGKAVIDILLEHTDPQKVGFELDTFWAMRAGADPIEYMRKYKNRISLLHQKDMSKNSKSPVNIFQKLEREVSEEHIAAFKYCKQYVDKTDFTEIGTGIMDIQSIIDAANENGMIDYMILEQDDTQLQDEIISIKKSMEEFHKFSGIDWE